MTIAPLTGPIRVDAMEWEHGWELHVHSLGMTQVRTLPDAVTQVRDFVETVTGTRPGVERVDLRVLKVTDDGGSA